MYNFDRSTAKTLTLEKIVSLTMVKAVLVKVMTLVQMTEKAVMMSAKKRRTKLVTYHGKL